MIRPRLLLIFLLLGPGAPARAESFESWSAKAGKALKAKRDAAALEDYDKALVLWQDGDGRAAKAAALAARAALYEKAGRHAEAKQDLSQAIALSPKRASYFHQRGRVELAAGELETAITDLYRATALDLGLSDAYLDRGLAYARQGDLQFAREDYLTACKLGVKTGCARAAALKRRMSETGKPARTEDEPFEAMTPEKNSPVEIRRGPAQERKKLDLRSCRAALDSCVESGLSFGECVAGSRPCARPEAKDCCPEPCLKAFKRQAEARSEAAAFRDVFEEGRCGENLVND